MNMKTGRKLYQHILNKNNHPFNVVIEPLRIELRQSTEKYNISINYLTDVIEYFEEHITSNITIGELTRIVFLSRRNLENKFREATGTSIYQFILDKKMDYITHELLNTDKSLLDIAIDIGFKDVRSLYRNFKKYKGYTPISFRKKFSGKNPVN